MEGKKKGQKVPGVPGQLGVKRMKRVCLCYPTIAHISWSQELLWEGASWVLAKLILKFFSGISS